jgi:hypothetical protein
MNNNPFYFQLNNTNLSQLLQTQNIQSINQPQLINIQPKIQLTQPNQLLLNSINQFQIQQPVNVQHQTQSFNQSPSSYFIINLPPQNSISNNLIQNEVNNFVAPISIPVNSINAQSILVNNKQSNDILTQINEKNSTDLIEIDKDGKQKETESTTSSKSTSNESEKYKFKFGKYNKSKKKIENSFVNDNDAEFEKEKDNTDVLYSYVCEYCKKKKKRFPSQYGLSCHLRDVHKLSQEKIGQISADCVSEMIQTDNLIAHLNASALISSKKCYTKDDCSSIEEKQTQESNKDNNSKSIYDKDNTEMKEFNDFKLIDKKRKKIRKQGLTSLQKRSSHLAFNQVEDEYLVDENKEFTISSNIDKQNLNATSIRTRSKQK